MRRVWVVLLVVGCGDDVPPGSTLVAELRTDFVPGAEFTAVRTELVEPMRFASAPAFLEDSFLETRRVAEIDFVEDGDYRLVVTLLDPRGAPLSSRGVRVQQRGSTAVTVVMTRDCRAMECPDGESCLGGRCVDVTCLDGTEASCPAAACSADGDCPASMGCATARCDDGSCLLAGPATACGSSEYCHPEDGCLAVPGEGCGDGRVGPLEECDDGNSAARDGCSPTCELENQGMGGFTCASALRLSLVPTGEGRRGALAIHDTRTATDALAGSCGGTGAEDMVYELVLERESDVTVSVAPRDADDDYDTLLHIRGMDGRACIDPMGESVCADSLGALGAEAVSLSLSAGTHFIIVDGASSRPGGAYVLEVDVRP